MVDVGRRAVDVEGREGGWMDVWQNGEIIVADWCG